MREINAAARGVVFHVAQNVRQLQRLTEINGVVVARGIFVAENFDAQKPDDGGDAMAIKFKLGAVFVTQRVQIHFATFDEFVE